MDWSRFAILVALKFNPFTGRFDYSRSDSEILAVGDPRYVNISGDTMTGDLSVPDEVYGNSWNGSAEVPTKNALFDKIDLIDTFIGTTLPATYLKLDASNDPITGNLVITPSTSVTGLTINAAASSIGQVIKANATTPGDLFQFQNSAGNAIAGIEGRGTFYSHLGTPTSNLILGKSAGNTTMTGIENVFLGESCGRVVTSGQRNLVIGYQAGYALTEGSYNVALGRTALYACTTGGENFAMGYFALGAVTTQSSNVAIGTSALRYGTQSASTAIGAGAGTSTQGVYNTFIGALAGGLYTAEVRTSIDYNVAIGYAALYSIGSGCDNNVAIGTYAGQNMTSGSSNILIGYYAGVVNTANSNTFIGANAGRYNTSGNANLFIGNNAGYNNTIGVTDIAIGNAALYSNTEGTNNIAIGNNAVRNNTTGSTNIGIGANSLYANVSESYNVAIGVSALEDCLTGYNTAVGALALASQTDGLRNLAIGYGSFNALTDGDYNVGIGMSTGVSSNGSRNTYIGYYAGQSATGSDGIFIGYQAGRYETGNHKLYIANSNTTTPLIYGEFNTPILKIYGSLVVNEDGNSAYDVRFEGDTDANLFVADASADKIGIGTASPSEKLHVVGNIFVDTDSNKVLLGAGKDMSIYYDGTSGYIKTSEVAAGDLHIACGTDKTLVLDESVWDDVQFSISSGRVAAANYPDWDATFTSNTGEYKFDVDDYIDLGTNEMAHWWKEGTTIKPHVHVALDGANSSGSNQYVKFIAYIAYSDDSEVYTETNVSGELTIPTGTADLTCLRVDLTDLALTNNKIGTQVKVRLKRIAATAGTEYPNHIFVTQFGIHAEKDTMGSRQVGIK